MNKLSSIEVLHPRKSVVFGLIGMIMLTGCSKGFEAEIESCGQRGTPIEATFKGASSYKPELDPALLANFGGQKDISLEDKTDGLLHFEDSVDEVGEIVCYPKGDEDDSSNKPVLTTQGAKLSSLYTTSNSDN